MYALLKYGNEDDAAETRTQSSTPLNRSPDKMAETSGALLVLDLLPTTTSITVRGNGAVANGPFDWADKDLLGVDVINVETFAEAVAIAQRYLENGRGISTCEIRPVAC